MTDDSLLSLYSSIEKMIGIVNNLDSWSFLNGVLTVWLYKSFHFMLNEMDFFKCETNWDNYLFPLNNLLFTLIIVVVCKNVFLEC